MPRGGNFKRKVWTTQEDTWLKYMWPLHPREDIKKRFPTRSWKAIYLRAMVLGVRRNKTRQVGIGLKEYNTHPLIKELVRARVRMNLSQGEVAKNMGYSKSHYAAWERGVECPRWLQMVDWAAALGLELKLEMKTQNENGVQGAMRSNGQRGYTGIRSVRSVDL